MNYVIRILLAMLLMLFIVPLSTAINNPTVDVKISIERDYKITDIIINNPDQKDISLTGIQYTASYPLESSLSLNWDMPIIIKANGSYIYRVRESIFQPSLLYRKFPTNITASGSLFIRIDSNSFVVPFQKTVAIVFEIGGANQTVSPNITDVKFKISILTDEKGKVREVISTTNISIYNPNPVAFLLPELNCEVIAMYKEDEKLRTLKTLQGCGIITMIVINPMDTYVYSAERRISDNDSIQYFVNEEPKYLRVKGSAFLIPNETGWNPAYFEPTFNTLITMTNVSIVNEENASTPTPTPTYISTSTPQKDVPGFVVVFTTISLLTTAFLLKKRN